MSGIQLHLIQLYPLSAARNDSGVDELDSIGSFMLEYLPNATTDTRYAIILLYVFHLKHALSEHLHAQRGEYFP